MNILKYIWGWITYPRTIRQFSKITSEYDALLNEILDNFEEEKEAHHANLALIVIECGGELTIHEESKEIAESALWAVDIQEEGGSTKLKVIKIDE